MYIYETSSIQRLYFFTAKDARSIIMSSNFSPVNLSASPVAQASLQASYCVSKVLMCFCSSATALGGNGAGCRIED